MKVFRLVPLCALLALAACSGSDVTETLGLGKEAPDEFVVVSRPPLVVPPDFDLSPPRPGEEPPHATSTETQARKVLLGADEDKKALSGAGAASASLGSAFDTGASDTPTLDEFMNGSSAPPKVETAVEPVIANDPLSAPSASFLKNAGADSANQNIRSELRAAVVTPPPEKKEAGSLYERWLGDAAEEPVVDPAGESERLRTNKDEGKPVTEGETPTEDSSKKSVLDRIF